MHTTTFVSLNELQCRNSNLGAKKSWAFHPMGVCSCEMEALWFKENCVAFKKEKGEKKIHAQATMWCQESTSWMWNLDGKRQNRMSAFIFAPEKRKTTMANTVAFTSAHVITCGLKVTEAMLGSSKGSKVFRTLFSLQLPIEFVVLVTALKTYSWASPSPCFHHLQSACQCRQDIMDMKRLFKRLSQTPSQMT